MEISASLNEGLQAHQAGDLETAFRCYRDVLASDPDHPDGLHYLGLLLFDKEDPDHAISLIQRSLAIDGGNASAHNNLGNIFKLIDRKDEALAEYVKAVASDPDHQAAWNNLGILSAGAGTDRKALETLADLVERLPDRGEAWRIYGLALNRARRPEEAADALDKSLEFGIGSLSHAIRAARYLYALGREERAIRHLERLASAHPEEPEVRFYLAASRGEMLEHAPEDYLKSHFDSFSETFDEVLHDLDYTTPEHVARMAKALAAQEERRFSDAADLGCGTGLCGPLIREICGKLTGVDLSHGMLQQAARKNAYDFLVEGEMIAFLNADLPVLFDLCVCVDTLCYIGDLTAFFAGLDKALKPGGFLVASVERLEKDGGTYVLNASGRYAHSSDYVRSSAEAAGMIYGSEEAVVLRKEFGMDVNGIIFHVRKREAV